MHHMSVQACLRISVPMPLQVAEPEDACANLTVPVLDSKPWIALIKRSERARTDCSFDIKVRGPTGLLQGLAVM